MQTVVGATVFIVLGFLMGGWGCGFKTKAQVEIERNPE
jgi:hypothetical protein